MIGRTYQQILQSLLLGFPRETSRKIYNLSKGLCNGKISYLNTGLECLCHKLWYALNITEEKDFVDGWRNSVVSILPEIMSNIL